MVEQGYDKYKGGVFKVPQLFHWLVVVTGPRMIEELRQAGDDELNITEFMSELLQTRYTFGKSPHIKNYEHSLFRTKLTRSLGTIFPALMEEIVSAFTDTTSLSDDWTKVSALTTMTDVTNRVISRIFVGISLCRNEDYRKSNTTFARGAIAAAFVIRLFPKFLRPFVGPILTPLPRAVHHIAQLLKPVINEKIRSDEKLGSDYEDKPNTFLSWLMDVSHERDPALLACRIIGVNFAAIRTTSLTFTHALYRLAAHPEYVTVLREEIDTIVAEEGWTKDVMQRMARLDSFMRESQRFEGLTSLTVSRRAVKDYTFSDGTFVPKGTFLAAAARPVHRDGELYENGTEFNPWRFSDLRVKEGESLKYQMTSVGTENLPWGHGKHSCPGRFFAVLTMKTMLAHIVANYDVRLEQDGQIPPPQWVAAALLPNRNANVFFRKRQI